MPHNLPRRDKTVASCDYPIVAPANNRLALPTPGTVSPLALAEARLTQVEAELRQTLAEEQISNLEAQASYLAARVCQLEAELAEVRTQRDNLEVERDEWKRLAQRLLTPKRSWWWPFS